MSFNSKGYLEPGLHAMSLTEVEQEFVIPFPHSSTRKNIIDGYKRHTEELTAIEPEWTQLVDGSFVSNKNDPGDIDMICFADGDRVDALPPAEQAKLRVLVAGKGTKATHLCDAYFCPSYPQGHPNYDAYRTQRKYWMGEFGFDRTDVPKGIVMVEHKAPPAAPPVSSPPTPASPATSP